MGKELKGRRKLMSAHLNVKFPFWFARSCSSMKHGSEETSRYVLQRKTVLEWSWVQSSWMVKMFLRVVRMLQPLFSN